MPGEGEGAPAAAGATDQLAPAGGPPESAAGESSSGQSAGTSSTPAAANDTPSNTSPSGSDRTPSSGSTNEFAPSLLDEAGAKPATEAPKPADAAAVDAAAKPADAQPPAQPAPAAADGKPADQAKPDGQGEPAAPPAPIEYAFTMEGADGNRVALDASQVDPERMGAFTGLLNEARVAPETAQKFVDMHLAEMRRVADRTAEHQWEVFREQQRVSRDEVMAHPVLGGSRHDTAMQTIMSAIDAFGLRKTDSPRSADDVTSERRRLMDDFRATGIANRVSLLEFLHWVGDTYVKEAVPRPAPPPRAAMPTGRDRGLSRYRSTTPGT